SFKEVQTYTLSVQPEFGSVVVDPPGGEYNPGTVVTLIPEGDPGYYFEQWMGDLSGSDNPATITMDTDKTVNARFVYAGAGTTTNAINCGGSDYKAIDGTSYSADMSGGASFSTNSDISGTEDDQLYQTERFGKNFSYAIPVENGSYQITLMFAEIFHSSAGQRVFNVSIEGEEVINNLDIYTKAGKNAAYNETHEVTITDGVINIAFTTVTDNAKISAIKVNNNSYIGETFMLSTDGTSNGVIEAYPAEGPYPAGSNVLLTAIPDTGFMFTSWNGDLTGSENPATLYMNADKNISATFAATNWYTLTTSATNGTISFDPEKGIYGYTEGTVVSLTASPDEGYSFTGWGGDLEGIETPSATILMNGDKNVIANFEKIPVFTLTVNVSNGSVELNPAGGSYEEGTVVTVQAVPDNGFAFNGWSGDLSGNENPTTIIMDSDKEITADILDAISFTLTTYAENGSIQISPESTVYSPGSAAILIAIPDEGYIFDKWTGDLSGTQNPTSIIMDEDKTVTAEFTIITSIIDEFNNRSASNALGQNYPNPFTNKTTIHYLIKEASDVKLTIYNYLGLHIATLVNEYQSAGAHSVTWYANDAKGKKLANGLYFYRLETNHNAAQIKKACLVR
ncbi:MAG TPA: malectin domain-containing carbohydrate-binding protein, partial [Bacteroidales bacterium]|nr:malectin domain-containing carbohydrate-binding protein [Bacteroidales bacterium]